MSTLVDPRITALETLLARKRSLTSLGVSLDGYHRWGNGSDPAFEAEASRQLAGRDAVISELKVLTKRHRRQAPEVLEAWARAHIELLEDYLTRVDDDSTEAFVAGKEMDSWREVAAGTLDFVEENPVYVKPDQETYRRLFDCDLPKLYW